jgi:alpha-L-arabinofuranosidase
VAGQWYLLTGVYDAAAGTLSLYVNGRLQESTPAPAGWTAAGHLVIGRGRFGGNPVDFVDGAIDDVRVYDAPLAAADVEQLALNGLWRFDEGTGTVAHDDALAPHDGALSAGAGWTTGIVGEHAVALDGASGAVDVPDPVLDTSQSFSIAAWVRVDAASGFRTAVSVDGDQVSGFYLQRRNDGRFAFTRLASDAPAAAAAVASADDTAWTGQWYHLVGVYDRPGGTLTLYVNGTRQGSVAFTTPWRAAGHLAIGRGRFGGAPVDFLGGAVDDVRAYPFVLDAAGAAALATSGRWRFDEGAGTVAHDDSPNRADGTLDRATWTGGASGRAVAFAGDGRVSMGAVPALDFGTDAASLSAWFRTASSARQTVLAKGAGYALTLDGGRVVGRIGSASVTSAAGYADDLWHHAALVRSPQGLTLYLDGAAVATAAADGSDASDAGAAFSVGEGVTGAVDEVQVVHFALSAAQVAAMAGANTIDVDAADARTAIHSTHYGAILEDISHSVEGGLYAELVRNRTFKENGTAHWALLQAGGAAGSFAVDTTQPLNAAIDRSLKLHVASLGAGGRVAVSNDGFYGVAVAPSTTYTGSLWAKASAGFSGRLVVSLEKPDRTVLASRALGAVGAAWAQKPYSLTTPAAIAPSTSNRVVVSLESDRAISDQDVWLSVVSLFPPTYKNRPNGLRRDLMDKLAAMHLGLFRIPGGNYLEGNTLATRFDWKRTIGPIWERPGHQNTAWGYWSSDGMGLLEYLQLAEDVGAQPLLALFAGYTLNGQHVPEDQFEPYVQDALDEIEYAIGDTSTAWGAKRAADGHPAPFDLHYVEVGNEDWFDSSGSYAWRFTRMYLAIKARYPQLKVIATTGGYQGGAASSTATGTTPDVFDDHYYQPPSWFVDNSTRYDRADRSRPQVLIGEYGAQNGSPTPTLRAAVGEAAFLTGLERNSDIVIGSMYAPILVNENAPNWPANMIGLDACSSYGSPSYWVQQLFATNLGTTTVGATLGGAATLKQVVTMAARGRARTFYVKVVNPTAMQQSARISFRGVRRIDPTATLTVLTGDPDARNTLAHPDAVVPASRKVSGVGMSSRFVFPPSSVTVLRVSGAT